MKSIDIIISHIKKILLSVTCSEWFATVCSEWFPTLIPQDVVIKYWQPELHTVTTVTDWHCCRDTGCDSGPGLGYSAMTVTDCQTRTAALTPGVTDSHGGP